MSKDELYEKFKEMFPDWTKNVVSYKKIGSKTLAIEFDTGCCCGSHFSRVFLYNNPNDWQFGTKLWRKRPEKIDNRTFSNEEEIKDEEK